MSVASLHYFDEEGDRVLLFTNDDLKDAVVGARASAKKYIRLIVPLSSLSPTTNRRLDINTNTTSIMNELTKGSNNVATSSNTEETSRRDSLNNFQMAALAATVALAGVAVQLLKKN